MPGRRWGGVSVAGGFRTTPVPQSPTVTTFPLPAHRWGSRTGAPTVGAGWQFQPLRVGPQSGSLCVSARDLVDGNAAMWSAQIVAL